MARKSRKNIDTAAVEIEQSAKIYNAAAYLRLSSDDKKKRGDSIATQRDIIENFIAMNSDIRLVEVYTDNNATGTNFDRPGFQRMLADCENGKINCIIVKDLTRFGRSAIDGGYYIQKYLPSIGVRFIAVTDPFDSNEGDGGILLPLKNIIAESYALDISRKCKAVQQQNIRDGRFVGRMTPYGYIKDPQDCHKLLIDPVAATVVKQIFDWAAVGANAREISRRLNANGTLPPILYKQTSGIIVNNTDSSNSLWQERTVKQICTDQVYVGDMVQGKTKKVNHKQFFINPSEWVCVPNTHEAIISREQFEMVQRIREQVTKSDAEKRVSQGAYSPNLFKGKIFCAHCGKTIHRNRQNKDGTYWFRCQSQWAYGKETCGIVSVKEADVKAEIITLLHKHSAVLLGKYIQIDKKSTAQNSSTELRTINSELNGTSRFLKTLYESLVTGIIDADEFRQMKSDYEAKITALSERADEIRSDSREIEAKKSEYDNLTDAVSAVIRDDKLTGEIIDRLVDKILVYTGNKFEIHFKFADEFQEAA
jgi:DNA invertase Pin-like site-specific DNA recombinase